MDTELIVGLDVDDADRAMAVVEQCGGCRWFKVGSQLFTRCGPQIVESLQERGRQVMLDLKFHDIPNTVRSAIRAASDLGAGLLTIHASGGRAMIAAAREAVSGTETRILAVTVLTSLDEQALRKEVGMPESPEAAVQRLSRMAVEAGAHGVVCSPREIAAVRAATPKDTVVVTPGVRPAWSAANDQARTMTPREAAEAGADFVVVARPVLQHANPGEAVRDIQKELAGA